MNRQRPRHYKHAAPASEALAGAAGWYWDRLLLKRRFVRTHVGDRLSCMRPPSDRLPHDFLERLRRIVPGDQIEQVLASFHEPKMLAFRVNPLRTSIDEASAELQRQGIPAEPVAWSAGTFLVDPEYRAALTHSSLCESGAIYVQGLSSILATQVLDPQPGEQVLDLAAAPGGKATHIAALMKNQGWLSVVEPIRARMYTLAEILNRAGVTIAHTYLMDGRRVGRKVPGRFDRVMLDAPCSGEARFHTSRPDAWKFWSERKLREQSRKQIGLIRSAFQSLRPGGRMLYGTCSFAPEENEAIVDHLLASFPKDADLESVSLPVDHWQQGLTCFHGRTFDERLKHAWRILPNSRHDGYFLALVTQRAIDPAVGRRNTMNSPDLLPHRQ